MNAVGTVLGDTTLLPYTQNMSIAGQGRYRKTAGVETWRF